MKGDKIAQRFENYLESNKEIINKTSDNTKPSIIFGTDEFEIKANKIKLPEIGWIQLEKISKAKNISWVAITDVEEDGYEISFGYRICPFSEEAKEILLVIDDIIVAVPFKTYKDSLESGVLDDFLENNA